MIPLILVLALSQGQAGVRRTNGSIPTSRGGPNPAAQRSDRGQVWSAATAYVNAIHFATASGVGMGSPCTGAALTSVEGDRLLLVRDGGAYCTTGNSDVAGIPVGGLVWLTTNQPRAMVGSDPSGVVGLLLEQQGLNVVADPNDWTTANWTPYGVGVAAPTITKNACLAPDGTMTGTRLQMPAVTAVDESAVFQSITGEEGGPFSKSSQSFYVKGYGSDAGTTGLFNFTGAWSTGANCAYAGDGGFNRCLNEAVSSSGYILIGNSGVKAGHSFPAADLCVWGAQAEPGENATSFMPTLPRGGEAAFFPFSNCIPTIATYCPNDAAKKNLGFVARNTPAIPHPAMSWTMVTPKSVRQAPDFVSFLEATVDSQNYSRAELSTSRFVCDYNFHGTGSQVVVWDAGIPSHSVVNFACNYDGGVREACVGAQCTTVAGHVDITQQEAVALSFGRGFVYTGVEDGGQFGDGTFAPNAVIKNVVYRALP